MSFWPSFICPVLSLSLSLSFSFCKTQTFLFFFFHAVFSVQVFFIVFSRWSLAALFLRLLPWSSSSGELSAVESWRGLLCLGGKIQVRLSRSMLSLSFSLSLSLSLSFPLSFFSTACLHSLRFHRIRCGSFGFISNTNLMSTRQLPKPRHVSLFVFSFLGQFDCQVQRLLAAHPKVSSVFVCLITFLVSSECAVFCFLPKVFEKYPYTVIAEIIVCVKFSYSGLLELSHTINFRIAGTGSHTLVCMHGFLVLLNFVLSAKSTKQMK